MRRIELQPPGGRKWQRWLADCEEATTRLYEQVAAGARPTVRKLYKRPSIKKSYFFSQCPPFYGKCAYCEAPIVAYQHGEHQCCSSRSMDIPSTLDVMKGNLRYRHPQFDLYAWCPVLPCQACRFDHVLNDPDEPPYETSTYQVELDGWRRCDQEPQDPETYGFPCKYAKRGEPGLAASGRSFERCAMDSYSGDTGTCRHRSTA